MGGGVLRGPCGSPHFSGADPCNLYSRRGGEGGCCTASYSVLHRVLAREKEVSKVPRHALEPLTMSLRRPFPRSGTLGRCGGELTSKLASPGRALEGLVGGHWAPEGGNSAAAAWGGGSDVAKQHEVIAASSAANPSRTSILECALSQSTANGNCCGTACFHVLLI